MHAQREVDEVLRLMGVGLNDCQISRATGIPRHTILDWRHGRLPGISQRLGVGAPAGVRDAITRRSTSRRTPTCFGLYLGDGWLTQGPRAYRLRIVQDARYPGLIRLATQTIVRVRGENAKVGLVKKVGCVEIYNHWKHYPCLFPQHGPGKKHRRPIELAEWQSRIVDNYPRQLLRGLIHSDGCRALNRVWHGRYVYPRYFFTNMSEDILQIFRDACDAVGVPHRNSRPNTISVAKHDGVAALDAFIGPKA